MLSSLLLPFFSLGILMHHYFSRTDHASSSYLTMLPFVAISFVQPLLTYRSDAPALGHCTHRHGKNFRKRQFVHEKILHEKVLIRL